MGNPGNLNFKGLGIVPVQRIFIPVQNLCIFFNPQGSGKLKFKFIIMIPLNSPKDFGGKLCLCAPNIRYGKAEGFHKGHLGIKFIFFAP